MPRQADEIVFLFFNHEITGNRKQPLEQLVGANKCPPMDNTIKQRPTWVVLIVLLRELRWVDLLLFFSDCPRAAGGWLFTQEMHPHCRR